MKWFQFIAEQKINKAIENGELKTEGWKDKPLDLSNDHMVPDDLKMAYKLLKNAGYVPPEVEARKEISRLEQLIATTEDEHTRIRQMRKLSVLLTKVEANRSTPSNISLDDEYYNKIVERTTLNAKKTK